MPRPRKARRVRFNPIFTYFKPAGVRLRELEEVILTVDEFEAIRLKDIEGLDQEQIGKKMDISQPTLHRLLVSARKKITNAIVKGKAIRIQGGVYKMVQPRGRGRMGGFGSGLGGECICPKCGHKIAHQRAVPCYKQKCPKCGANMTRGR